MNYEDYLERAKQQLAACGDNEDYRKMIYEIFPELQESEDEKIRKELIRFIEKNSFKTDPISIRLITWIKKQKPANKVEPKFKVGDWVVCNYSSKYHGGNQIVQVEKLDDETFGYTLDDETYFSGCFENDYHLWTIQDAKDGDVLYCKKDDLEIIVMYLGINIYNNVDSYCRYNSDLGFNTYITNVLDAEHDFITPATNEQRELLFSKMKEACCEWDAEKKELKDIECASTWSEEDEKMVESCLLFVNANRTHPLATKCIDWLKSIKDRV